MKNKIFIFLGIIFISFGSVYLYFFDDLYNQKKEVNIIKFNNYEIPKLSDNYFDDISKKTMNNLTIFYALNEIHINFLKELHFNDNRLKSVIVIKEKYQQLLEKNKKLKDYIETNKGYLQNNYKKFLKKEFKNYESYFNYYKNKNDNLYELKKLILLETIMLNQINTINKTIEDKIILNNYIKNIKSIIIDLNTI